MNNIHKKSFPAWVGNLTGAFADGALLFPFIIALATETGMNSVILMASAGAFYILSGLFFKIPMPVQPLKSIAISAVALGASTLEIRTATFAIGFFCLFMLLAPVEKLEKYIPRHLIHGVQFSLGVLLIVKGADAVWAEYSILSLVILGAAVASAIFIQSRTIIPILGMIATLGIIWALIVPVQSTPASHPLNQKDYIDLNIVLTLLLPQLALTLTNSVVGTYDTAQRYFGDGAVSVTLKKLLFSIGFGNIFSALIGGIPFCHGSGGLTAHVKAGAQDYSMNLYIGVFLLAISAITHFFAINFIPHYPPALVAALLTITGWYHMKLADKSWNMPRLRIIIVTMGSVTLLTSNILYALAAGIVVHFLINRRLLGAVT